MKKIDIKSVFIGIMLVVIVLLLGGWKFEEVSHRNTFSRVPYNITCSSDGSVIYVSNHYSVMLSKDFGNQWTQIHHNTIEY